MVELSPARSGLQLRLPLAIESHTLDGPVISDN